MYVCLIVMYVLFGVLLYCVGLYAIPLGVGLNMLRVGVAMYLGHYWGIVYNSGLGIYWAKICVYGGYPCIGCIIVLGVG